MSGKAFDPGGPVSLVLKDGTRFEITRAASDLQQPGELTPLLNRCKPANFGDGKKTRFDRSVRDALQLSAEKPGFQVENFDPGSAGIVDEIQRTLIPYDPAPLHAELYALNAYTSGGHFARHKDTPRGSDMLGSLVVCLPSQFFPGGFSLYHRGIAQKFDWGAAIRSAKSAHQLHWVAFFGDVDHEIEQIYGGVRLTLAYLLKLSAVVASPPRKAAIDPTPIVQEAWAELLADRTFLPKGGTLAYPCGHLYNQDSRFAQDQIAITADSAAMLKGRDNLDAASALEAGLRVNFVPYLFEDCADETWQLNRFPTPK